MSVACVGLLGWWCHWCWCSSCSWPDAHPWRHADRLAFVGAASAALRFVYFSSWCISELCMRNIIYVCALCILFYQCYSTHATKFLRAAILQIFPSHSIPISISDSTYSISNLHRRTSWPRSACLVLRLFLTAPHFTSLSKFTYECDPGASASFACGRCALLDVPLPTGRTLAPVYRRHGVHKAPSLTRYLWRRCASIVGLGMGVGDLSPPRIWQRESRRNSSLSWRWSPRYAHALRWNKYM